MTDIDILNMIVSDIIEEDDRDEEMISWLVYQLTYSIDWIKENISLNDMNRLKNLVESLLKNNNEVQTCTYDNPKTMHRECWQNGLLICSYSSDLFDLKDGILPGILFFGANIGDWKAGQMVGNPLAIDPNA